MSYRQEQAWVVLNNWLFQLCRSSGFVLQAISYLLTSIFFKSIPSDWSVIVQLSRQRLIKLLAELRRFCWILAACPLPAMIIVSIGKSLPDCTICCFVDQREREREREREVSHLFQPPQG